MKKESKSIILCFAVFTLFFSAFSAIGPLAAVSQEFGAPTPTLGISSERSPAENNPDASALTSPTTAAQSPTPTVGLPATGAGEIAVTPTEVTSGEQPEVTETVTETNLADSQPVPPVSPVPLGFNKTDLLLNVQSVVRQQAVEIGENGRLKVEEPLTLELSFEAPLLGTDPAQPDAQPGAEPGQEHRIFKGDWAEFRLSDTFALVRPEDTALTGTPKADANEDETEETITEKEPIVRGLWHGEQYFGRLELNEDAKGVYARVLFDGDDVFYDGTHANIPLSLTVELTYAPSKDAGAEALYPGEHPVTLHVKKYLVVIPQPTPTPTPDMTSAALTAAAELITPEETPAPTETPASALIIPQDKTDILENVALTVSQNGLEIPENGSLNSQDPLSLRFSFEVPLHSSETTAVPDEQETRVLKGDWATFPLSEAFRLANEGDATAAEGARIVLLWSEEKPVARVEFAADSSEARIIFSGDDSFYNGAHENITLTFAADLIYDAEKAALAPGEHPLGVAGKNFNVTISEPALTNTDKTSLLIDIQSVVRQNGAEIAENGRLDSDAPISLELSFELPLLETAVAGEAQPGHILKGDWAEFLLSDAFKLVRDAAPANAGDLADATETEPIIRKLRIGELAAGRIEFSDGPAGVSARVLFDGDEALYDGSHENVRIGFTVDLIYSAPAETVAATPQAAFSVFRAALFSESAAETAGEGDVQTVTILGIPYTVGAALGIGIMAAPPDKTDVLTVTTFKVSQNDIEIPEGGTLDNKKPIKVEISFDVPVVGDDPDPLNPVLKGDYAIFPISDNLKLKSAADIPLTMTKGGITVNVGTVKFVTKTTDPDCLYETCARVDFDGDEEVFKIIDGKPMWSQVNASFNGELEYKGKESGTGDQTDTVTIFEKTFTVTIPANEKIFKVEKSGTAKIEDKKIIWEVKVTGTQEDDKGTDIDLDLAGYKFSDDLKNVGEYINGSFKVGGTAPTPGPVYGSDKILSYTFPAPSMSPKTITFETEISDALYYLNNTEKTVTNTGKLFDGETELAKAPGDAKFTTPEWIKKEGSKVDSTENSTCLTPDNCYITWTITANEKSLPLTNVTITDNLPAGLIWQSAKWEAWDSATGNWSTTEHGTFTSAPTGGLYEIGLVEPISGDRIIKSKVQLIIVAKVDREYFAGDKTYTNNATIRWEGMPGSITGPGSGVGVGVGYNAITKNGTKIDNRTEDPNHQEVLWTVKVTLAEDIPSPVVYDLLIYGSSAPNYPTGYSAGTISADILGNLTPRFDQTYIDASFLGSGLTPTVIPVMKGTERVGDLLMVEGFPSNVSVSTDYTFTFKTRILNPKLFAGNGNKSVTNEASLFSRTKELDFSNNTVTWTSNTMKKEMLKRGSNPETAAGANALASATEAFDYDDKSVIFRLSVNANGANLSGGIAAYDPVTGQQIALGAGTVTDTLPAGWEFVDIVTGKKFLLYEGNGQSSGVVNATGNYLDDTALGTLGLIDDFTTTGKAIFTFPTLTKPYVILVKARPDAATLEKYFNHNMTTPVIEKNNVKLTFKNGDPGASDDENVSIENKIITKKSIPSDGALTWTITYQPQGIARTNITLEDNIPEGIELRRDGATGNLKLNGADFKMVSMTQNPDGSLSEDSPVTLTEGQNITYDPVTRLLTIKIPDGPTAYTITYVTDITGELGDKIDNTVTVKASTVDETGKSDTYTITKADGDAVMTRSGWIRIIKTDRDTGLTLDGVEFTLYASPLDPATPVIIRQGITSGGKLLFKGIPIGNYILRETNPPGGYISDGLDHSVSISEVGGTFQTLLDGNPGNEITIKNYLESTSGSLKILKKVAGNAATYPAEQGKRFKFTITFTNAPDNYPFEGEGVRADGDLTKSLKSGDSILLAAGQSITINGLPKDATYTVTEEDYSADGYATGKIGDTGTIVALGTQTAEFTNTKDLFRKLTITKRVDGNAAGHPDVIGKEFEFTLTVTSVRGTDPTDYNYTRTSTSGGTAGGTIAAAGGAVSLKDGETVEISGIPWDATYTISEKDYKPEGFDTTDRARDNTTFTVINPDQSEAYTNTTNRYGELILRKRVAGSAASREQAFEFVVTFSGPFHDPATAYHYKGSGVPDGTIKSGDSIWLIHGQSIKIEQIPWQTVYSVEEKDTGELYRIVSSGANGVINTSGLVSGETHIADFLNEKDRWWDGPIFSPNTGDDDPALRIGRTGFLIFASLSLALFGMLLFSFRRPMKK